MEPGDPRSRIRPLPPETPVGAYFLLQEVGSNDLVMIDWRRSRLFRIPVDNGSVVSVMIP